MNSTSDSHGHHHGETHGHAELERVHHACRLRALRVERRGSRYRSYWLEYALERWEANAKEFAADVARLAKKTR